MSLFWVEILSNLILFGALISISLAALAWSGSKRGTARPFALFQGAIFVWCFFSYLRFRVPVPQDQLFYFRCEYVGIEFLPVAALAFARDIRGRPIKILGLVLLSLFPLATLVMAWGLDPHGLFMKADVGSSSLSLSFGPWYWLNAFYCYALICAVFQSLFLKARNTKGVSRRWLKHTIGLLALPAVINLLYLVGLAFPPARLVWLDRSFVAQGPPISSMAPPVALPGPGPRDSGDSLQMRPSPSPAPRAEGSEASNPFNPTPLAFAFSGVFIALALRRYNILDSVPFAKGVVFNAIKEPIITIDFEGRIIGANRGASALFPLMDSVEGPLLSELCPSLEPPPRPRRARGVGA